MSLRAADVPGAAERPEAPRRGAPLQARNFRLRPVADTDYRYLFDLSHHEEISFRWRLRNATPSPEGFVAGLWQGVLAQFVIEDAATRAPAGLISAYGADFRNRVVYLALMVEPERHRSRLAVEATALFLNYLFVGWEFRKVYAETTDLSYGAFAGGDGRYFRVEGVLAEHEYYDGRFWDMYILSFLRADWEPILERWMPRLLPRP